jgi:hypothetical protein
LIKKNFNKSLGKGVNNRPWWARWKPDAEREFSVFSGAFKTWATQCKGKHLGRFGCSPARVVVGLGCDQYSCFYLRDNGGGITPRLFAL